MAYQRLSKEKQTLVLMALCEGMPIRAAARMFKVGKRHDSPFDLFTFGNTSVTKDSATEQKQRYSASRNC